MKPRCTCLRRTGARPRRLRHRHPVRDGAARQRGRRNRHAGLAAVRPRRDRARHRHRGDVARDPRIAATARCLRASAPSWRSASRSRRDLTPAARLRRLADAAPSLRRDRRGPDRGHRRAMVVARRLWRRRAARERQRDPHSGRAPGRVHAQGADVIHSFWVPSLGGKVDMIPGARHGLRLTAERPGVYRGQCAEYCGGPHALMAFEVVAMPAAEYDAWLARARCRRRAPSRRAERRGQRCSSRPAAALPRGARHRRERHDRPGPHASRRPPLGRHRTRCPDAGNLGASSPTASIKPGNRMPRFRIFARTSTPRSPPIC